MCPSMCADIVVTDQMYEKIDFLVFGEIEVDYFRCLDILNNKTYELYIK